MCEGNGGSIVHILSSLEGTFTAGPCIQHCLPDGNTTIFIDGTSKDINHISRRFKHDSSGGISLKFKPLALAWIGILPRNKVPSHVLQIKTGVPKVYTEHVYTR